MRVLDEESPEKEVETMSDVQGLIQTGEQQTQVTKGEHDSSWNGSDNREIEMSAKSHASAFGKVPWVKKKSELDEDASKKNNDIGNMRDESSQEVAPSSAAPLHHLTRHWIPPEERGRRAIHILGAEDMKSAESAIRTMAQRDLRRAFEQIYESQTKSFNNVWLRRKLMEAIGSQSSSVKKRRNRKSVGPTMKQHTKRKPVPVMRYEPDGMQPQPSRQLRSKSHQVHSSIFPKAPPLFKTPGGNRNQDYDTTALDALARLASEHPLSPKGSSASRDFESRDSI